MNTMCAVYNCKHSLREPAKDNYSITFYMQPSHDGNRLELIACFDCATTMEAAMDNFPDLLEDVALPWYDDQDIYRRQEEYINRKDDATEETPEKVP